MISLLSLTESESRCEVVAPLCINQIQQSHIITEDYVLQDGAAVHVIVGEEEQDKLFALQELLDEEG